MNLRTYEHENPIKSNPTNPLPSPERFVGVWFDLRCVSCIAEIRREIKVEYFRSALFETLLKDVSEFTNLT